MTERWPSMVNSRPLRTDAWTLEVPKTLDSESPLLCIPTVHPRGDRRIISCAQVALDSGFRVMFVWLGGGTPSDDPMVQEIVLPAPSSTRERILATRRVAAIAEKSDAAIWHIHDYYMLPRAKRWHLRCGKPVVYDVHEYYAEYYAARLPVPSSLRAHVARAIESYQVRAASAFGGANVVTERMSEPFRQRDVPVSVSPNYPRRAPLESARSRPFNERNYAVLHMGTLTRDYGTETLVALAQRSKERSLPFTFAAVSRFPSMAAREEFLAMTDVAKVEIDMISPRAAHEMPELLSEYGFGLSLLARDSGQNDFAVPSKNVEHILMGLVAVVSNRPAQRQFVERWGCAVVLDEARLDDALDRMLALARDPATDAKLREAASAGRQSLTWEGVSAPALTGLYSRVFRSV
jgi:hypothetical protein